MKMDSIPGSDYRLDDPESPFEWSHDDDVSWAESLNAAEEFKDETRAPCPVNAASAPALVNLITGHHQPETRMNRRQLQWLQCAFLMAYRPLVVRADLDLVRLLIERWTTTATWANHGDPFLRNYREQLALLLGISTLLRAWVTVHHARIGSTCRFMLARWLKSVHWSDWRDAIMATGSSARETRSMMRQLRQLCADFAACRQLIGKSRDKYDCLGGDCRVLLLNSVRWVDPSILEDGENTLDQSTDSIDRRKHTLRHYLARKATTLKLGRHNVIHNHLNHHRVEEASPWSILLETPADQLALHLSLVQEQVFASVPWEHVLDVKKWSSVTDHATSLHPVSRAIHRFNVITEWVSWAILLGCREDCGQRRIEFFLKLAFELQTLHNYDTLMAVLLGIQHSAITRLSMWDRLPKRIRQQLHPNQSTIQNSDAILSQLCDPAKNWKNIRDRVDEAVLMPSLAVALVGDPMNLEQPPALGYFGLITSDLILNEESKNDKISSEVDSDVYLINVSKIYCKSRSIFRDFLCGCQGIRGFLDVEHFHERTRPSYASFYLADHHGKLDKRLFKICDALEKQVLLPLKSSAAAQYDARDLWTISNSIEK